METNLFPKFGYFTKRCLCLHWGAHKEPGLFQPYPLLATTKIKLEFPYSIRRWLQTSRATPQSLGALRATHYRLEARSFKSNDHSECSRKNSMLKWLKPSPNTNSLNFANFALEVVGETLNALKVLKESRVHQQHQALNAMGCGSIYSPLSKTSRYCFVRTDRSIRPQIQKWRQNGHRTCQN